MAEVRCKATCDDKVIAGKISNTDGNLMLLSKSPPITTILNDTLEISTTVLFSHDLRIRITIAPKIYTLDRSF